MPKTIISDDDRQEIRAALAGLSGPRAKAEVQRWADFKGCHISTIYTAAKDVRPPRKKRADSGKVRADIDHPLVKFAMGLVVANRIDPEDAIETTELQPEFAGQCFPVSLGTFRRLLRKRGLDRAQRREPRHPYRSWEAKAPLEKFQFDISGLKQRWWYDIKNRRILRLNELHVSDNHPNQNRNRVQVWSFHLLDDFSRFKYIRFVAVDKPNANHVISFLWQCFRELGIPLALYTDNDPIIVCKRMRRAADILDRLFADSGGFKLEQHMPGNAKATGKAENGHKIMQRFWNLIGLKRVPPDLATLNRHAANVCSKYACRPHRKTGLAPLVRLSMGHQAIRVPPPASLDAAFKAMPYRVSVAGDLTIRVEGDAYQLPRSAMLRVSEQTVPNPFLSLAGRRGDTFKIDVVWPPGVDYFVAVVDKKPYEFERILAVPDAASEFRSMPESIGQQTEKIARAHMAEVRRAHKAAGTEMVVQGIDVPFASQLDPVLVDGHSAVSGQRSAIAPGAVAANTRVFPRKKIETNPELLAALAPGTIPPSMFTDRYVSRWTAAEQLQAAGLLPPELTSADKAWLDHVFAGRDQMLDTELRALLAERGSSPMKGMAVLEMKTA